MKKLMNPDNGAEINELFRGDSVKICVGQTVRVEDDELYTYLKDKYGFLEEVYVSKKEEGKEDDTPILQVKPKAEQPIMERPFMTPGRMSAGQIAETPGNFVDADGVEWVGGALQNDSSMKADMRIRGQNGRFSA